MAHTPGPWAVVDRSVMGANGAPVDGLVILRMTEANQALILAAPELLSACMLALDAFENNHAIDWSVLSDAIAKAEGRQP